MWSEGVEYTDVVRGRRVHSLMWSEGVSSFVGMCKLCIFCHGCINCVSFVGVYKCCILCKNV